MLASRISLVQIHGCPRWISALTSFLCTGPLRTVEFSLYMYSRALYCMTVRYLAPLRVRSKVQITLYWVFVEVEIVIVGLRRESTCKPSKIRLFCLWFVCSMHNINKCMFITSSAPLIRGLYYSSFWVFWHLTQHIVRYTTMGVKDTHYPLYCPRQI